MEVGRRFAVRDEGIALLSALEETGSIREAVTRVKRFPASLLGAILLFGGLELATGALSGTLSRQDRYLLLITAGIAMWNIGAGHLAGLLLHHATRRGVVRL